MNKIYIAGPMAGYENKNLENFKIAEIVLKDQGWIVLNPGIHPTSDHITPAQYMDMDLAMVRTCDAIYMLEGWRNSKGAGVEFHYAIYLGLLILFEGGQRIDNLNVEFYQPLEKEKSK